MLQAMCLWAYIGVRDGLASTQSRFAWFVRLSFPSAAIDAAVVETAAIRSDASISR